MTILKGDIILTQRQCDVLRGLAIIGIFLHNFCHWLHGGHHENEYLFYKEHGLNMWNYWTSGADAFAPIQFFSFFGHYGVPIFLFLSGFGLVSKYEQQDAKKVGSFRFLSYQWLKLFRLMILGYILCVIVYDFWCGCDFHPWNEVVAQLTLTVNFIFQSPGSALMPGPYWFFGLMLEVYVIYRLLIYSTRSHALWRWLMPVLLVFVAWSLMAMCEHHTMRLNYLRYNAAVAMLPFAIGVLVARYGLPQFSKWVLVLVAIVSMPIVAIANLNFQAWLWAPIMIVAGSVAFVKLFERYSLQATGVVMRPLAWMGMMSSFIFVIHSVPRMPMFKFVLWRQPQLMMTDYAWLAAYIVLTLLLAWLYKQYLRLIPSPKLQ
jgi:peptidoglycan/LPS O-acetylase OafA/YrhL